MQDGDAADAPTPFTTAVTREMADDNAPVRQKEFQALETENLELKERLIKLEAVVSDLQQMFANDTKELERRIENILKTVFCAHIIPEVMKGTTSNGLIICENCQKRAQLLAGTVLGGKRF